MNIPFKNRSFILKKSDLSKKNNLELSLMFYLHEKRTFAISHHYSALCVLFARVKSQNIRDYVHILATIGLGSC